MQADLRRTATFMLGREGSQRTYENLPILIAGRGNGALKPGRFLKYPKGTPATNLWLTLLEKLDVHPESLGDSTRPTGTPHSRPPPICARICSLVNGHTVT